MWIYTYISDCAIQNRSYGNYFFKPVLIETCFVFQNVYKSSIILRYYNYRVISYIIHSFMTKTHLEFYIPKFPIQKYNFWMPVSSEISLVVQELNLYHFTCQNIHNFFLNITWTWRPYANFYFILIRFIQTERPFLKMSYLKTGSSLPTSEGLYLFFPGCEKHVFTRSNCRQVEQG